MSLGYSDDIDSTSIKEMEKDCATIFEFDKRIDELEEEISSTRKKRDELTASVQQRLQHFGKTSYQSNFGSVELRTKLSFKTPKTPEDKKAFFEYLQGKNILWEYATVNSNSLNSLCKAEYEIAMEESKEFKIPGISNPTEYQQVYLRKK